MVSALSEIDCIYLDGCPLLMDSLPLEWVASVRTNRRGEYEKSNFRCDVLSDVQEQQVCDMHASTALRVPAEQIALWEKVTAFGGKTYDGFPIKRAGGGPRSYSYSGSELELAEVFIFSVQSTSKAEGRTRSLLSSKLGVRLRPRRGKTEAVASSAAKRGSVPEPVVEPSSAAAAGTGVVSDSKGRDPPSPSSWWTARCAGPDHCKMPSRAAECDSRWATAPQPRHT